MYYKDPKFAKHLKAVQRERYYGPSRKEAKNSRHSWTEYEDKIIFDRSKSDKELAKLLSRSVQAIQLRRFKLKRRPKHEK